MIELGRAMILFGIIAGTVPGFILACITTPFFRVWIRLAVLGMLVAGQLREPQSNSNLNRLPRLPCSYGLSRLERGQRRLRTTMLQKRAYGKAILIAHGGADQQVREPSIEDGLTPSVSDD